MDPFSSTHGGLFQRSVPVNNTEARDGSCGKWFRDTVASQSELDPKLRDPNGVR